MKAVGSIVCAAAMLFGGGATANADGWSLANLNPFAKKDGATAQAAPVKKSTTSDAAKGMSGPTVPQLSKKTATAAPPQPTIFDKIGSGAGNMMNKTKQMFAPKKPQTSTAVALGSQTPKPKKADANSTSGWNPFAPKKPDPEPPHTASEFIGQPRPRL